MSGKARPWWVGEEVTVSNPAKGLASHEVLELLRKRWSSCAAGARFGHDQGVQAR